ncbi:iron-containing redox enzyme family protein [Cystobacter fuscus]|uniref:iron-containing redox enzyme family protein n=1 Tax=Cystobacter fuscus TaxID=43 RepID=UPI002B28FD46|nr:iron-containing redox enzyme family protein [Cystobacter fuscus]
MHTQNGTQSRMDWMETLEHEARTLVEDLEAHPTARKLFDGSIDAAGYSRYLVQAYHYVRWTTPLLMESGERMKRAGSHTALGELFLHKAAEERGHERWLLSDLKNLGWSAERVTAAGRCPAVNAYIAWNRYTALAGIPLAFLGTAYVLEYLAVHRAPQAVERLLAARNIPNIHKAVTFLRGHGEADGEHVAELTRLLRSMKDPREQSAMLLSARTTRSLYLGLFSSDARKAPEHPTH